MLSAAGVDYLNLSYSEASIIAEDLICDSIREALFQLITIIDFDKEIKAKKYAFDTSENPEKIKTTWKEQVKFDSKHINYSPALLDVYKVVEKQYEKEKKRRESENKKRK